MSRFHLFWVRTRNQWDDGLVVARTSRTAARYVREENFILDQKWASAERLTTLPDHFQDPCLAVGSTDEDPCHVDWASPEILLACGVTTVHSAPPRVFLWNETLLTEGFLDYLHAIAP